MQESYSINNSRGNLEVYSIHYYSLLLWLRNSSGFTSSFIYLFIWEIIIISWANNNLWVKESLESLSIIWYLNWSKLLFHYIPKLWDLASYKAKDLVESERHLQSRKEKKSLLIYIHIYLYLTCIFSIPSYKLQCSTNLCPSGLVSSRPPLSPRYHAITAKLRTAQTARKKTYCPFI